jgi:peptidoglycan/xylan/chitin deacetylase (PgdA/CDA1 family)
MYHYVRPIARSRYPGVKGMEVEAFREQLAYCRRHYHVIRAEDLLGRLEAGERLPARPLLLTFDDGYRDHYDHVFPILRELGLSGAYYPAAAAVRARRVLDVNKIQFVLAAASDPTPVVETIEQGIAASSGFADLLTIEQYRARFWTPSRFDPAPVHYCKQLLQHVLPVALRRRLVAALFSRFVTADEESFASELYVELEQLREMVSEGMHVGGHGDWHEWLHRLSREGQDREIAASFQLLDEIGVDRHHYTFCYPFGSFNADTTALLRQRGCRAAVTTRVDLARLEQDDALTLPRINANDLPAAAGAPPCRWTVMAMDGCAWE